MTKQGGLISPMIGVAKPHGTGDVSLKGDRSNKAPEKKKISLYMKT